MNTDPEIRFSVSYDDMYYMSLWCSACLAADLAEKADLLRGEAKRYDSEFDLRRLNDLAARHLAEKH